MNPNTVSAIEVKISPNENSNDAITLTFLYPKTRNNGPLKKPKDMDNAELILMIRVKSAAGICICSNLSLKINPKLLVVGMTIS